MSRKRVLVRCAASLEREENKRYKNVLLLCMPPYGQLRHVHLRY